MKELVCHLIPKADWEAALENGEYWPPQAEAEGFIHFSYPYQVRLTQQRYYRERDDLQLLVVSSERLGSNLKVENGFPHLYGPLSCQDVLEVKPRPAYRNLKVALVSQIFSKESDIGVTFEKIKQSGASLAVFPELTMDPWWPARRLADSPPPVFSNLEAIQRQCLESSLAAVATAVEQTLAGPRQAAYLFGASGERLLRYKKTHLPQEPGFWEQDYYQGGSHKPEVCDDLGFPLGLQICSDTNRPTGSFWLAASGASAILIPRATESGTFEKWRRVFQVLAQLTACYVLSVNRPAPEFGVPLGGPSIVVDPHGEIITESCDPIVVAELKHEEIVAARGGYPGYLSWQSPIGPMSHPLFDPLQLRS